MVSISMLDLRATYKNFKQEITLKVLFFLPRSIESPCHNRGNILMYHVLFLESKLELIATIIHLKSIAQCLPKNSYLPASETETFSYGEGPFHYKHPSGDWWIDQGRKPLFERCADFRRENLIESRGTFVWSENILTWPRKSWSGYS